MDRKVAKMAATVDRKRDARGIPDHGQKERRPGYPDHG
jgi:hypothetical protein